MLLLFYLITKKTKILATEKKLNRFLLNKEEKNVNYNSSLFHNMSD